MNLSKTNIKIRNWTEKKNKNEVTNENNPFEFEFLNDGDRLSIVLHIEKEESNFDSATLPYKVLVPNFELQICIFKNTST